MMQDDIDIQKLVFGVHVLDIILHKLHSAPKTYMFLVGN